MMSNRNCNNIDRVVVMESGQATAPKGFNQGLKKGPWTVAEDAILIEYVKKHGEGNWNSVQKNFRLMRCGKSCRLRWANHLRPNLKKGSFTPDEEKIIIELHAKHGNKWARMASQVNILVHVASCLFLTSPPFE
jgi:myb proto-oncogene protein